MNDGFSTPLLTVHHPSLHMVMVQEVVLVHQWFISDLDYNPSQVVVKVTPWQPSCTRLVVLVGGGWALILWQAPVTGGGGISGQLAVLDSRCLNLYSPSCVLALSRVCSSSGSPFPLPSLVSEKNNLIMPCFTFSLFWLNQLITCPTFWMVTISLLYQVVLDQSLLDVCRDVSTLPMWFMQWDRCGWRTCTTSYAGWSFAGSRTV